MLAKKKIIRYAPAILFCLIVFYCVRYAFLMLPVFTAGAAKITCSCLYVGERTLASIEDAELAHAPLNLCNIQVDNSNQTVTASVFRLGKRTAIYRDGLGCSLASETSEQQIRNQTITRPPVLLYDPDTLHWPMGNILDSNIFQSTNSKAIQEVVPCFLLKIKRN